MVKAVVLDPENQFNVERTLTKDDVQKLIKTCVDRLLMNNSPSLDTIKMQVYFDMNYTNRSEFLEEHKRVLESRLQPVMREITDSRARTREELEGLYRKIVSCVLLRSGLGSPTDISVVREATAALQSVFPQTELGTFMSLAKRDKERQLRELTQIVTGIRLFNKECGKGGEGIDNLPSILNEAIPSATMNIENELNSTRLHISRYTGLIERQNAENLADPDPELIRQALINCRQHEAFLKVLLTDVVVATDQINTLERDLRSVLIQLQNTIQSKTAVPTNQVYPKFISLAKIWTGFQDEMVLLSVISNIQTNLEPFTKSHRDVLPDSLLQPLLTGLILRSDEERVNETSGLDDRVEHAPQFKNLEFLFPETTRNFSNLPLQYKGFCGFCIATQDRLLVPGNPLIGILRYKDHFFCFSSKDAAVKFAADPDSPTIGCRQAKIIALNTVPCLTSMTCTDIVVLDPENQFNVERTLTKDDVQKLIKTCVDRLLMNNSPSLDTIKMQVYFDMNYTNRSEFLEEHKRVLESRLQPVMREITDSRARTREELEGLYRKIVSCVLLRSGLGSPTDISVVREATAALQSVFPQTELGTFMSLAKRDKERQLRELTQIVTGIRLFNKECGKGGEGIDNLPSILNEAIPSATMNIENELNSTRLHISRYTGLIERQNAENLADPDPELIRQALINCRQHEAFLKVLLTDVVVATDQINTLERDLRSVLIQLQNTIQSKTAVPTNQVYPKFISLAKIWTGFQDEMVLLSVISNIQTNLEPFTKSHRDVLPDSLLQPLLTGLILRSDEERVNETSGLDDRVEHAPQFKNLEFLFPETTRNFSNLPLQYKGFCGFCIATQDRLLVPGNPLIGILRYKDHFFCFSSKDAAVKFAADPDSPTIGCRQAKIIALNTVPCLTSMTCTDTVRLTQSTSVC
eukprot:sb/3461803/